ncbi:hypothetical protein ACSCBZ_46720 [Streptomyces niveiscabiei]|uniref:hypothetical protein n=1 Tax=Streptomyces niveiscabiei TaxID=164115 RepID=UPI0006EBD0E4|nr:hypothetical protein [Streptomyces niveiscabiei]
MSETTDAPAGAQYRADYSDSRTYSPLEQTYTDLRAAQKRCEDDLRAVRQDGPQMEFRWEPDLGVPPLMWRMTVRTPYSSGLFLSPGYRVVVVGSPYDGGPPTPQTDTEEQ